MTHLRDKFEVHVILIITQQITEFQNTQSRTQAFNTMATTSPTQTRPQKIEEMREKASPTTFDEWVCLGGDFRDEAEVQEWATPEESRKLHVDFEIFRNKVKKNTTPEDAFDYYGNKRPASRSTHPEEDESIVKCYWCEDTDGVTLVKSHQLYGCRECAEVCSSTNIH